MQVNLTPQEIDQLTMLLRGARIKAILEVAEAKARGSELEAHAAQESVLDIADLHNKLCADSGVLMQPHR